MNSRAQPLLDLKEKEMQLHMEATNVVEKAKHYRNAAAAMDKYYCIPASSMEHVPDNVPVWKDDDDDDDDIIISSHDEHWVRLPKNLIMTTKGQIFSSPDDKKGKKQIRMGESTITSASSNTTNQ